MKTLKIKSYLRAAALEELYINEAIVENKEVFYKSVYTNNFEGPYFLNQHKNYVELSVQIGLNMVYVIDQQKVTETSIPFKLKLQQASIGDLKQSVSDYKYNSCYYVLTEKKEMEGPFYISGSTDITELNKKLNYKLVYILNRNQNFELLTGAKTA